MKKTNNLQHLRAGAEQLIAKMKSPSAFLCFLTDTLNWLRQYDVQKRKNKVGDDQHFTAIVLIEEVVIPWFAGGPDIVENVASGIEKVHQYCGAEGFRELTNAIEVSRGFYSEGSDWTSAGQREYNNNMSAMIDILCAMEEYEASDASEVLTAA
jgi:hypothetical protein